MAPIIGIDLGTTNSAVAIVNEFGRPEILPNREGGRVTPSVVMFDASGPVVGEIARASAVMRPGDTAQFVKRHMGEPDWSFRTSAGEELSAEAISARILARLKEDAEAHLGEPVTKAVISVPAYFDDARRTATIDAATIAGLEVVRLLNEPTAAALAYGLNARDAETVLVYDLGGGTFDVTIMRVNVDAGAEFTVLATDGDTRLGGYDWDNALMNWLDEQFSATGAPSLLAEPESEQMLRDHAVRAKHTLTTRDEANVFLSWRGFNEKIVLTRALFDDVTAPLLARTARCIDKALEDAGLTWAAIDKCVLVGGSSRMPQVSMLVTQLSGHIPLTEVNPDEAVALGASIYAALAGEAGAVPILTGSGERLDAITLHDVTAHSMGVVIAENHGVNRLNSIIVPKGTVIPCFLTGMYSTTIDNQTEWQCEVTEGEETDLQYVNIVGTGTISLPGNAPAGTVMEVAMNYDANGIINVFVRDLDRMMVGELAIDRTVNLTDAQIIESRGRLETVGVS
jgi:molecular chaperone DnaK